MVITVSPLRDLGNWDTYIMPEFLLLVTFSNDRIRPITKNGEWNEL